MQALAELFRGHARTRVSTGGGYFGANLIFILCLGQFFVSQARLANEELAQAEYEDQVRAKVTAARADTRPGMTTEQLRQRLHGSTSYGIAQFLITAMQALAELFRWNGNREPSRM